MCGRVIEMTPDNILRGKSCRLCAFEKFTRDKYYTNDEFVSRVYDAVGDEYTFLEDYVSSKTKISVIHNKCNYIYKVAPQNFFRGRRCPKCSKSHAELFIEKWLTINGFSFEREYRFDDCRHILPLPFDFKINFDGHFVLLEYDGLQHKKGWYRKNDDLDFIQYKDGIKDKYCAENGIKLLRAEHYLYERPGRNNNRLIEFLKENLCVDAK